MRNFIGFGKGDPVSAVDQATAGLSNPSCIIFFADYDAAPEIGRIFHTRYPDIPTFGAFGAHLANGRVSEDELFICAFFNDAMIETGVFEQFSVCPVSEIYKFNKSVEAVGPGENDTCVIEICTASCAERLISSVCSSLAAYNISLCGGALWDMKGREGFVVYNGEVYRDACVFAVVKNLVGKVRVYKKNIYVCSENAVRHFATKVDRKRSALIELDDKLAIDVYSEELGIPKDKIIDSVFQHPFGRAVLNDVFTCSQKEITPEGEIIMYKQINHADCVYLLELGDYKKIEEDFVKSVNADFNGHFSFIFSVDCIYRYLLYAQTNYLDEYAKLMSSQNQQLGFVSGGEQYNNQHVNQTCVCAVFE